MSNSNVVDNSLPDLDPVPNSALGKPNDYPTLSPDNTNQNKTREQLFVKQDNQTLINSLPGNLSASTRSVHLISDYPRFTLTKINPIRIQ